MINKLIKVICFALVFVGILCSLDYITGKNIYSSSSWEKVQNGESDILIMGNSHAFTGIDAKILSQAMGREIIHLGSSAQNMENALEALKITLKYYTPEVILLEVNAACHDSKEVLQNESRGMLFDNLDGVNNYFYKAGGVVNLFRWDTIPEGVFQLFRPTDMWERWKEKEKEDKYGFVVKNSYAYGEYNFEEKEKVIEKFCLEGEVQELAGYNEEALKKFLKLTEEKGIKVILYKAPIIRESVVKRVNNVFSIADNYSNVVAMDNMLLYMTDMGLALEDFYDSGHLNRRGAEKFTYYYGNMVAEKLDIDIDWNRVFGYKNENIIENTDGTYTYIMDNYDAECLYQFKLYVNGECIEQSEYSKNNKFTCTYDVNSEEENVEVRCSMIPGEDAELGNKSHSRISLKFMHQNDCHIGE